MFQKIAVKEIVNKETRKYARKLTSMFLVVWCRLKIDNSSGLYIQFVTYSTAVIEVDSTFGERRKYHRHGAVEAEHNFHKCGDVYQTLGTRRSTSTCGFGLLSRGRINGAPRLISMSEVLAVSPMDLGS